MAQDDESTPRGLVAAALLAALLGGCSKHEPGADPAASTALVGAPSPSASAAAKAPPAGPVELAILAPIVVGSTSKGWKIEAISAVHEGAITVRFVEEKGRGVVDLFVSASSDDGAPPPATAGRYAIFYSVRRALPEHGDRLAGVLARAIEKNAAAPVPPGLAPYNARAPEHQPM